MYRQSYNYKNDKYTYRKLLKQNIKWYCYENVFFRTPDCADYSIKITWFLYKMKEEREREREREGRGEKWLKKREWLVCEILLKFFMKNMILESLSIFILIKINVLRAHIWEREREREKFMLYMSFIFRSCYKCNI